MDHSKQRPAMPGHTPSPAPMGKTSVYQGTTMPRFEESFLAARQDKESAAQAGLSEGQLAQTGNISLNEFTATQQRKSQMKVIEKMLNQLPYNVREKASTIINMAMDTAESASKQLETYHREVLQLKTELNKKYLEVEAGNRKVSMYQQKIAAVEAANEVHKEEVHLKSHFHLRNKHILGKVATTNRMLTNSLEVLQGLGTAQETSSANLRSSSADGLRAGSLPPMDRGESVVSAAKLSDINGMGMETALALAVVPLTRPSTRGIDSPEVPNTRIIATSAAGGVAGSGGPLEKLRESLLRVTREHGKSTKQGNNLEREVRSLKRSIKDLTGANRQLKSELEEMKSIKSGDDSIAQSAAAAAAAAAPSGSKPSSTGSDGMHMSGEPQAAPYRPRLRNFGKMDDRFTALLKRDALEPLEGIKVMRRVLQFMANAPPATNLIEVAQYVVSRDMTKIFDAEIACVHLLSSSMNECYKQDTLRKITPRSNDVETFDSREYRGSGKDEREPTSIAWETIRSGHALRLNTIHGRVASNFNKLVDGVPGVIPKRFLSVPLKNFLTNEIIGAISLINKNNPADAFSEADELMCLLLCDQVSALLSQCALHDRSLQAANIYRTTMEAAVALYNVVPPPDAMSADRAFTPGQLLNEMELVGKIALKCKRARAFLVSDCVPNMEPGLLVLGTAERKTSSGAMAIDTDWKTANTISSIAGRVAVTGQLMTIFADDVRPPGDESDHSKLNPYVDLALDSSTKVIVTVPIMDQNGKVYAVLQLVPSGSSPPFDIQEKFEGQQTAGNVIYFPQVAQWIGYQMLNSLKHLVKFIGHKLRSPVFHPLEFYRREVARADQAALLATGGSVADGSAADEDDETSLQEETEEEMMAKRAKALAAIGIAKGTRNQGTIATVSKPHGPDSTKTDTDTDTVSNETAANERASVAIAEAESAKAALAAAEAANVALTASVADANATASNRVAALEKLVVELQAKISELSAKPASPSKPIIPTKSGTPAKEDAGEQLRGAKEATEKAVEAHRQAEAKAKALEEQLAKATETNTALTQQLVKMANDSAVSAAKSAAGAKKPPSAAPMAVGSTLEQGSGEEKSRPSSQQGVRNSRPPSRENPLSAKPPASPPQASKPSSAGGAGAGAGTKAPVSTHLEGSLPGAEDSTMSTSDWQPAQDEHGNTYYYNTVTGASSWEVPAELAGGFTESTDAFVGMTFGDWAQMFDKDGNEYWVNSLTHESVWELPAEVTNSFTSKEISSRPNSSTVKASAGGYEIEL